MSDEQPTEVFQRRVPDTEPPQDEPGLAMKTLALLVASAILTFLGAVWGHVLYDLALWSWGLFE